MNKKKLILVSRNSHSNSSLNFEKNTSNISRSLYNRLIEPLKYLTEEYNNEYELLVLDKEDTKKAANKNDLVFLCKHYSEEYIELCNYLKKESINYFYDIDDLIYINTKNSNIGSKDINLDSFYKILSNATKVICSNIYIKEKLNRDFDYLNIGIIPTCINTKKYLPQFIKKTNRSIHLTNGDKLKIVKNRDLFLKALNNFLDKKKYQLECISDDKTLPYAINNIDYLGIMKWDDHKKFLSQTKAEFAIIPLGTKEENSIDYDFSLGKTPIKYLEYASFGIPGIYSKHPIYDEIIQDEFNGLLVDNNLESWGNALNKLSSNLELREKIIRNARNDVEKNFDISLMASLWRETINDQKLYF